MVTVVAGIRTAIQSHFFALVLMVGLLGIVGGRNRSHSDFLFDFFLLVVSTDDVDVQGHPTLLHS